VKAEKVRRRKGWWG